MPGRFGFLPHARAAIAAQTSRDGARLTSRFDIRVLGDGAQQGALMPMPATLRGPGDVTGLAAAQITRWEPEPGERGFEPAYFPFVEFMDVDLPWRFSLTTGNPARLMPWLALVALADDEVQGLDQGRAPLPRILVKSAAKSLPDPAQAWATAHVQVNMDDAGQRDAAQMLADDPGNGFSRLICARRLMPRTRYQLFLVPLYEAGRLAGLGRAVDPAVGAQAAWTFGTDAPVELPYYARNELTTDDGADLEQLLRKLRAFKADGDNEPGGPRRASANQPGYYPDYTGRRRSFEIQTALVQADRQTEGYNTDPALAKRMSATLAEVIRGESADDDDEDPLVAFPPYGFRYRMETEALPARARQGRWFDRLNLDLKMRHAAALGARVVEANQDVFMQYAWDQYESLQEANAKLRGLALAHDLAKRLSDKHLGKLSPSVQTVLAEPLQPYVTLDRRSGGQSIADTLVASGSPGAYASRGLRRLASKRPVRMAAVGGSDAATFAGCVVPTPQMKGDRDAPKAAVIETRPSPFVAGGKVTGDLAKLYTTRFGPDVQLAMPVRHTFKVKSFSSAVFAREIVGTLEALPSLKAKFLIRGLTPAETAVPAPVWRAPRIPVPMAERLTKVARNAILSGIGDLPDNTVSIFAENRAFVEAFMVGANHAMNDELRWREFPTDMRGTIFDRFWDRGAAPDDVASADIAPIHSWTAPLGANRNPANPDGNPALVIVIKGDIVRKLGLPHMVINESTAANWKPGTGKDHEAVFFGKTSREVMYFGFDLPNARVMQNPQAFRLVLFEPMGRLRFGLDVGSAKVRRERLGFGARSLPFPMQHRSLDKRVMPPAIARIDPPAVQALTDWDQLSWDHMTMGASGYVSFQVNLPALAGGDLWGANKTSASLARSFWQKPVAGVVPFTRILP